MAIISLVIGIIVLFATGIVFRALPGRMIFAHLGSPMIAFPLSIVGLIPGILAVRRKSKRGIAIAVIILNLIVLLAFVAVVVVWGIVGD